MNTDTAKIIQDERFVLFLMSNIDSIGCETIRKIDDHIGSLSEIFEYSNQDLKCNLGLRDAQIDGFNQAKRQLSHIICEYDALKRSQIRFITYKDSDYPARLKGIKQSPAVLYAYGTIPDDDQPSVGIVGSRACTEYGASVAEYFGQALAQNGVSVISGMAIGIDAYAHRGALHTASGRTYAVLAGGVNVIYPRENKYIYDQLYNGQRGGIISETVPGKAAIARNFPMRNRIISGLSDIVIVIESREKSGSLITVDYARQQGRPVMAVPGRITDPMSKGTNRLIMDGNMIVTSPEDVLKVLNTNRVIRADNLAAKTTEDVNIRLNSVHCSKQGKNKEIENLLDNTEKIVYGTFDSDPKHIEIILRDSALPRDAVLEALISLELKGLISQVSSNYYVCKSVNDTR